MGRARRALLRTGAVVTLSGLAGCFVGEGCRRAHFEMNEVSDERIVRAFATMPDELGPLGRRLVRIAATDGGATYTTTEESPTLPLRRSPVALDGRYYRIDTSTGRTGTTTGYRLRFVANETVRTEAMAEETVPLTNCPRRIERSC